MATRVPPYALSSIGFLFASVFCAAALAQNGNGFKFNNLSVSPYVNLEYEYDSNVDYDKNEYSDSILRVTPGVDLTYTGNDWGLSGNGWYSYDKYLDYNELDGNRYGESLRFYREAAKGWRLMLGQRYTKDDQNDSIIDGGRGLWREREETEWNGALAYELSEKTEVTLSGMFSDISYANDGDMYSDLYGWQEWSVGLEVAHRLTEKSNLLLNGSYQEYESDGAKGISSESTGYTLMGGFGSRATERITYRALTGVSWFDYAEGDQMQGWTYSLDANWIINRKVAASISGSSYFQPSESEMNQAMQVYALSAGLTYRPMRKLSTRFDVAYRREESEYATTDDEALTDDRYSLRVRTDYQLMRYVTVYGGLEYEDQISNNSDNEFDRYRASLGLSFRY